MVDDEARGSDLIFGMDAGKSPPAFQLHRACDDKEA